MPQHRAYAHALSVLPEMLDYRWTLIADIDEYFGFDTAAFRGVADYLAWQDRQQADAVALPWLLHVANGQPHVWKVPDNNPALAQDPQTTHAWISHCIFRSAPELMMKIARGQGDVATAERDGRAVDLIKRFAELSRDKLVSDPRMPVCASALPAELARLRALPGVAACDAQVKQDFAAAMEQACARFVQAGAAPGEPPDCAAFRSLLSRRKHDSLFSMVA